MKRYVKYAILISCIIALFVLLNIVNMPNRFFSYTYALADKYVFTTKDKIPVFSVGEPTLVTATKSDGTKYDQMYINKLGEIRVPVTGIENVDSKMDFEIKVTLNGEDVTKDFIIEKTDIKNEAMTVILTMKDEETYVASSYVITVSVDYEWEEETEAQVTEASRVKIIRDEAIGSLAWASASTNNWDRSSLQAILNGRYYNATGFYDSIGLTDEAKALMSEVKWNIGSYDTSDASALIFYDKERGNTVYESNPEEWMGYVGLIYPSDYGFAVGDSARTNCLEQSLGSYNSNNCYTSNWLYDHQWTILSSTFAENSIFYIHEDGYINNSDNSSDTLSVRPVVYLDTDIAIIDGLGTESSPYIIKKSTSTTNNLVQKIKTLAETDTTNLAFDGTIDDNLRYIGSNPDNYITFNGELWRIIGVMNNVLGNDGKTLVMQNNTVSHTTSFSLVEKYYNFEGDIETKTSYINNPSNKNNEWEIVLTDFEEIDASKFSYKLTDSSGIDYTSSSRFSITSPSDTDDEKIYLISNSYRGVRPKAGTYTFTVTYSNIDLSNSRGELTKNFDIIVGEREVTIEEESPVDSHQYIRTPSTIPVTLQVVNLTNKAITFRDGENTSTLTISDFNKMYSESSIQNISHTEDGDVVYSFFYNDNTYLIYRVTDSMVYYINLESEVTDDSGNVIYRFELAKKDFETRFPKQLDALEASNYFIDDAGDVYCASNANKETIILTIAVANKTINASGGGVFYFTYKYSGLEEADFNEYLTYKIFNANGKEMTIDDGFTIKEEKLTVDDEENGHFAFTLDYNNTEESYIGEYYIRFYINDGNEIITKDIGFSLYESEVDYYVNHRTDSSVFSKNSNKQIEHYIGFYLRKGSVQSKTLNPYSISIKIYDSRADLDSEGNIYYYDLIDYELKFVNKKDDNITYQVFEGKEEVEGSPFTTTIEELKNSKYSQAAELIDNYKFDETTGDLITSSTNYKEDEKTSIEIITEKYVDEDKVQLLKFKENGVEKECSSTEFKTKYPNMHAYWQLNFVFDENGNIVVGRVKESYRANEGKVGHDVTDQFNISVDQSGTDIDHAIKILPKTEVYPQTYYGYVAYENLQGVGHLNNDPESLITKAEFPEQWNQNSHMTIMGFDDPEYSFMIDDPILSNEGDNNSIIYDNIGGKATFGLTIFDTFNYENKFSYAIYYHDLSDGQVGNIDWGEPIQTSESTDKIFNVTSDIFSMIERTELTPYKTTLSVSTIEGVPHLKGEYKIVLSYSNNGVTNTNEQTFKIGGKYYGLVLDEEKTDELSFILNYEETKNIVFKSYFVRNFDNIDIRMIQENSSGDIELNREVIDDTSGKYTLNGEDKFTYQIARERIDDDLSIYTFRLSNIKGKPQSAQYHLYFTYKEDEGDEVTTAVDFVVDPASYLWEIAKEDVPSANGTTMYFTKEINTTHIEDFNQFVFKVMGFDGKRYVDVSSEEAKTKEFESVELIDKECSGLECSAKVKITLKLDTDKKRDYYLYSEYINKDDTTDIGNLDLLFDWSIANVKISGSYYDPVNNRDHMVDGFYKNVEDTIIDITLDTSRTDKINWELNRTCLKTNSICEVNNPKTTKYNDFFTEVSNGNKRLKLRVNNEYLKENSKYFSIQDYSLVLYFSENDYKVYTLQVHGNYVLVKLGDVSLYSYVIGSNGEEKIIANDLFKNKNGRINVPVTIVGLNYDDPGINISLKNANSTVDYLGRTFEFNREKFNSDKTIVMDYLASSQNVAISQNYILTVEYSNGEENFIDHLDFRLNERYFNYEIAEPNYEPNPLIPNNGGKIKFRITTEDIPNIQFGAGNSESTSEKYTMMRNAKVLDNKGNDVTSKFTKSVANASGNNTFDLTLAFVAKALDPGDYTLKMVYEIEGMELTKEKKFSVGNYAKELEVSRVEIISPTTDNRVHKNVGGIYRLYYESSYNINPGFIDVKIFSGEKNVIDKFVISVQNRYIDIKYEASTDLDAGNFNVVLSYQDDDMIEGATTVTQNIILYGIYKQIDLSNLNSNSLPIYADRDNQYYTFTVNKQLIIDDLDNLKWIITDADGVDVTKNFKVINNLNNDTENFKVEIIPFRSPVGQYHIRLYLLEDGALDKDEERMYSNTLDISIDDTYYKINMIDTSTISQVKNYNSDDKTSIYDRDGAKGEYRFISTYPNTDLSKYTLALTDNKGKIIKELNSTFINTNGTLSVNFDTGAITEAGDYKVMVCINHLPYAGLNMKVVKFIPVTKVTLKINNANVGNSYTAYSNTTYKTEFVVEPVNATNKNFTLKSNNTNVAVINGTDILTKNGGLASLTLTNGDMTVAVSLNVQDRISSSVYTISHTDRTIFVSSMTKKELTKTEFMNNIKGYTSFQILDESNKDITDSTRLIGTSMSLKVSGITYKIIVIGDVTGDGKINTADVAQLYQHIRKKKLITDKYKLKAAYVRKQSSIAAGDVSKLLQFSLGKYSSL